MLGLKEGYFLLGLGSVFFAFSTLLSPASASAGGSQCCIGLISLAGIGSVILSYYTLHKKKDQLSQESKKGYELGIVALLFLCFFVFCSILYGFALGADILDLARDRDATIKDLLDIVKRDSGTLVVVNFLTTVAFIIVTISPTFWKRKKLFQIIFISGIFLLIFPIIPNYYHGMDVITELEDEYGDIQLDDKEVVEDVQGKIADQHNYIFIGLIAIGYLLLSVPNFFTCMEYDFEEDEIDKKIDKRLQNRDDTYSAIRLPLAPYQTIQRKKQPPGPEKPRFDTAVYRIKPISQHQKMPYPLYTQWKPMPPLKLQPRPVGSGRTTTRLGTNLCGTCGRLVGADFIYCPYCGKLIR